jgi:hypothetical protein
MMTAVQHSPRHPKRFTKKKTFCEISHTATNWRKKKILCVQHVLAVKNVLLGHGIDVHLSLLQYISKCNILSNNDLTPPVALVSFQVGEMSSPQSIVYLVTNFAVLPQLPGRQSPEWGGQESGGSQGCVILPMSRQGYAVAFAFSGLNFFGRRRLIF